MPFALNRNASLALWRNKGKLAAALIFAVLPLLASAQPRPAAPPAGQPAPPPAAVEPNVDEKPCRSRDAYCQGYVTGILDSLRIAGNVCLPEAVGAPRVEFIVRDWLSLHPTLVSQAGAEVIGNALRKSFPCK